MARHQRSLTPFLPPAHSQSAASFSAAARVRIFSHCPAPAGEAISPVRPAGGRRAAAGHSRIRPFGQNADLTKPFGQNAPRAAAGSCGAAGSTARASGRDTLLDLTILYLTILYWTIYVMAAGAGQPAAAERRVRPPLGRKRAVTGP